MPNFSSPYYEANYANFETELYSQIRCEAFGKDIGQNSWLTADEHDTFLGWLALASDKTALDVACGSGGPALRMAAQTGCSVIGVDINEQAILTANSSASRHQLNERVAFHVVNATEQSPFTDASFDAITCIDAIHHLPDRLSVINDWSRLLKCGGRLLFTNPATVTGPITGEEVAVRSSVGLLIFVPPNYDKDVIAQADLRLLECRDVSANTARIAEKRRLAREARSAALRTVEGDATFEAQQKFLAVTARLARERRLSRFVYVSEKII